MPYPSILAIVCLALCSCASVSVKKVQLLTTRPPSKVPVKIFIPPPTFYEPGLRVDRSGPRLEKFKYEMQDKFARRLVRRLSKHVAPAEAVAATAPLPRGNYWVLISRFDMMNQGSRLLRSVFGFGAGGTKLEMSVVICDLSGKRPKPFLLIQTSGGSNAPPGAIGTAAYFVTGVTALFSAANLFEGTRSGLTFDSIRTSREITASLTEYLAEQGALPPEKTLRSRRARNSPRGTQPIDPNAARRGAISVTPASSTP
ncbi:MAG TPA: DUF4410 domain-containing protein [Terrimicrobiaceae bacterium]